MLDWNTCALVYYIPRKIRKISRTLLLTCMSVTCNSVITIDYNSYVKCTWKYNWIMYMYLMGCLDWHIDRCISWFVGCYLIDTPPLHWLNIYYRAVWVRALAGDIVLCSWATLSTLTVPLSIQVYKWVPANLMLGLTLWWTSIPSRGE